MITPSSGSWPSGTAQRILERRDPVEQVCDEADCCVVKRESRPQPLYPGECGQLTGREPQLARRVLTGVDDAKRYQPSDQVRVRTGRSGECAEVQPRGPDERVVHCLLLGSKSDAAASCSKSSRWVGESVAGTRILASANRSPGWPRGLGRPRPRSRSRFPHDVPCGTLTLASPPGVSTATEVPSAASQGASRSSTCRSRPWMR